MLAPDDPLLRPLALGPQAVPGVHAGPHHGPGYWRYLLPEAALTWRLPLERRATCAKCPMIEARGFRPDYRCCTYLPLVPGFAVGLALLEGSAAARLEALIAGGMMTPEGLQPSPLARFHARRQDAGGLYGKGETLCHLLDAASGRCTLYAFRNGVCATFFCVHDHGALGEGFWASLRDLACQLETALQQWALGAVGFDLGGYMAELDAMAADPLAASDPVTRAWSDDALARLWGRWRGRERELFVTLAELVAARRVELGRLAAEQVVVEPRRFEDALTALCGDAPDTEGTALPASPASPAMLATHARELNRMLWTLPAPDQLLRLSPAASVDPAAGRLCFDPRFEPKVASSARAALISSSQDESGDYWELDVTHDEAEAMLYFSAPRRLDDAWSNCAALRRLPDPQAFLAECIANQVLYTQP